MYKREMFNQAEIRKKEMQNCRDGEPDPYIIIILTQL